MKPIHFQYQSEYQLRTLQLLESLLTLSSILQIVEHLIQLICVMMNIHLVEDLKFKNPHLQSQETVALYYSNHHIIILIYY